VAEVVLTKTMRISWCRFDSCRCQSWRCAFESHFID